MRPPPRWRRSIGSLPEPQRLGARGPGFLRGFLALGKEEKERKKTRFLFSAPPEGPSGLGPGTEAGGGVCQDGSLPRGVALVKSPACLIWRRVARGKKEKSRGVGVERGSHLPHHFLTSIKHLLLTPSCPERPAWPLGPCHGVYSQD